MEDKSEQDCEIIRVVCGADEAYAQHMAAMLTSLILNCSQRRRLAIYMFDGGIPRGCKQKVERVLRQVGNGKVDFTWISPDLSDLAGLRVVGHVSKSAFLRLLIPRFLSRQAEKAIYLDCDLIVEKNIINLWDTNIANYSHAAVQDVAVPYVSDPRGVQLYEERGFDPFSPYFNSGVLVVNLPWWRKKNVSKNVFQYVRTRSESMVFNDQDALNYILGERWKPLDRRWNVPPKVFGYKDWDNTRFKKEVGNEIRDLQDDPCIIHFIGEDKPWMYGVEVPWQERYFHYLRESGWFGSKWEWKKWRLEKALEYYRRGLSEKSRRLYSGFKRSLVPVARFLGVARSSRQ